MASAKLSSPAAAGQSGESSKRARKSDHPCDGGFSAASAESKGPTDRAVERNLADKEKNLADKE